MRLSQKILSLVVLVLIVVGGVLLYLHFANNPKATHDGEITIIILDRDGTELGNKIIAYNEGDTFVDILDKSGFDFVFSDPGEWGVMVNSILGFSPGATEWWNHDHNGDMSQFGVSSQPFADKDVFTFQLKSWE